MSMRWVVAAVVGLAAGAANAASYEPVPETALARIDRAHREGRITGTEHALLGLTLVRAPHELPEPYRPLAEEPALRCANELVRRAFVLAQRGAFDERQMKTYRRFGGPVARPNLGANIYVDPIATIHYVPGNDVEANAVAAFLQSSWNVEFTTMGWRQPVADLGTDVDVDPGTELDIYLDPAATSGGLAVPLDTVLGPEAWDDVAAFIVIEAGAADIESVVAHELHHASQYAYDYQDGDFIYEATAVWIEDRVFDDVNAYTFFVPDFQNNPARTLSYADYSNLYMYGGAVFIHYLSDVHDNGGHTLVRDVWDGLKNAGLDWYDGVTAEVTGFSDIGGLYADFAGYRALTGARDTGALEEGENLGSVKIEEGYASIALLADGTTSDPPMGMGANYLLVTPGDAEDGDTVVLTVRSSEPGPWRITGIGRPASGDATVEVFTDDDGDGTVEAEVTAFGAAEVIFAVTNAANAADGADVLSGTTHSVDTTTHPFSWTFTKGEEEATGCACTVSRRSSRLDRGALACSLLVGLAVAWRRRGSRG